MDTKFNDGEGGGLSTASDPSSAPSLGSSSQPLSGTIRGPPPYSAGILAEAGPCFSAVVGGGGGRLCCCCLMAGDYEGFDGFEREGRRMDSVVSGDGGCWCFGCVTVVVMKGCRSCTPSRVLLFIFVIEPVMIIDGASFAAIIISISFIGGLGHRADGVGSSEE